MTKNQAESPLMDALESPAGPATPAPELAAPRSPRIWKFWGTALWGLFVFAAMFAGQMAVVAWFVWRQDGPIDFAAAIRVVGGGLTISLSVIMGLPAVIAALWVAIRFSRTPFADYLALRRFAWSNLLIGAAALFVLVMGWDQVSRMTGREVTPGFMGDVLQSARADGALWLLVIAFCVAAPVSEELFARGFLYRGWSESYLRIPGAILLSSLVWTALHLQYDWFFGGEVFSIGLLFGYLRYRSNSIWLTIILHGCNNLGAVVQTMLLTGGG
jgi:membrane protease YdiL (CAAX protease family)